MKTKLATFLFVLICILELGMAQDRAVAGTSAEKAAAPRQTDHDQPLAAPAPAGVASPGRSAPNAVSSILVETTPTTDPSKTDGIGSSAIADWRDRVFKSLRASLTQHGQEDSPSGGLLSQTRLDEQNREKRTATRIVLRETLKYARERVPELDTLIRALKLEISNRPRRQNVTPSTTTHAVGAKPAAVAAVPEDKLYLKTGLRLPVENRKVCVVSESEVQYGKLTSFFEVNLDGTYDRKVGLTYLLGEDARLQLARSVTHEDAIFTNDHETMRTSLSMVQLIFIF